MGKGNPPLPALLTPFLATKTGKKRIELLKIARRPPSVLTLGDDKKKLLQNPLSFRSAERKEKARAPPYSRGAWKLSSNHAWWWGWAGRGRECARRCKWRSAGKPWCPTPPGHPTDRTQAGRRGEKSGDQERETVIHTWTDCHVNTYVVSNTAKKMLNKNHSRWPKYHTQLAKTWVSTKSRSQSCCLFFFNQYTYWYI